MLMNYANSQRPGLNHIWIEFEKVRVAFQNSIQSLSVLKAQHHIAKKESSLAYMDDIPTV